MGGRARIRAFADGRPPGVLLWMVLWLLVFGRSIQPLLGDAIWMKDGSVVYGRILSESAEAVVMLPKRPAGQEGASDSAATEIPKQKILGFAQYLEPNRLTTLKAGEYEAYLNYADELTQYDRDQEAVEWATRLYVIAADQGGRDIKTRALKGLRAMPAHQDKMDSIDSMLRWNGDWIPELGLASELQDSAVLDQESARAFLVWLKGVRTGAGQSMPVESRDAFRKVHRVAAEIMGWEELIIGAERGSWSRVQELRLLRMEVAIETAMVSRRMPDLEGSTWSSERFETLPAGTIPKPIGRLFGIDPEQSIFRGGNWIHPDSSDRRDRASDGER